MPLIKLEHLEKVVLGVWETQEDGDFFLQQLPPGYLTGYQPQRFSERRKREFLASRWLLKQILQDDAIVLTPDAQGKPKAASGQFYFSLSHSGNRVAAIVSTKHQVGIDIEEINPRVKKVMHKFLNEHESKLLGDNANLWRIVLCWSAKESLFKMAETPGMSFSEEMMLDVPVEEAGIFSARVRLNGDWKQMPIHYEKSEEYVLTWCGEGL